jgi:predicted ferric reductase
MTNLLWLATRSLGTTSYLLLSAEMVLGLTLTTRSLDGRSLLQASRLHRTLSLMAVLTAAAHAALLLFDEKVPFSLRDVLLPFTSSYRPLAVGLGSIALYLLVVLELSHRARRLLGATAWRSLHALAFVLYVASTFHGIAAGSDTGRWGMRLLYLGSAGLVTFLLLLRMFRLIVRPERRARRTNARTADGFVVAARGNIDGDGVFSELTQQATVRNGGVMLHDEHIVKDEFE